MSVSQIQKGQRKHRIGSPGFFSSCYKFMPCFRIILNNYSILSSGPFWQIQGKSIINQIAWILPRTMHVSPFTSLDGPRRSKSRTVDFGFTTGTSPKAVDLIHTYKYPSSCYHLSFFSSPPPHPLWRVISRKTLNA